MADDDLPEISAQRPFALRVLILIAMIGMVVLIMKLSSVLLLLFAAALFAVALDGVARLLRRRLGVPEKRAVPAAIFLVAAVGAGIGVLFGVTLLGQFDELFAALPAAVDRAGDIVGIADASAKVKGALGDQIGQVDVLPNAAGAGATAVKAVANMIVVVIAAIYFALSPGAYLAGLRQLVPPSHREQAAEAMALTGRALRLWLVGQAVVMVIVGGFSGLVYWWLGLPSPIALGVIAGVFNFVPLIGPVVGTFPAVVFALNVDMSTVLWTVAAAMAIQQFESSVAMPLVQQRTVALPPALVLFSIVAFGLLFGLLGAVFAVPMTVCLFVLVRKFYLKDALGEDIDVLG